MKDSLRYLLVRLDERCKNMHTDIIEIKNNGTTTKQRINTLETTAIKHRTYFKAIPWTLGILATLGGLVRVVYLFVQ